MTSRIKFSLLSLALLVGGSGLAVYSVLAQVEQSAQNGAPAGITFPIQELGGCTSKDECKTYCNDSSHMQACIAFAQSHGLMNKDEASRAKKFSQELQGQGGPGGCKTPGECESYCKDISHLDECIAFAKEHGVRGGNTGTGEKIQQFLKSGGQMPGGCTSEESCKTYCGDFSHAKECFEFAQKAGIAQNVSGNNAPPEQLQKFADLASQGQTPGGCTSKETCETYCRDQNHRDECISFGEKAGFISSEQANKIRQTGGKGPGGCDSEESCHTYCSDQSHHDECFAFAEDHGFMSHEEARQAKEGFVRVRAGFDNAPPEVTACITTQVGGDTLGNIQSGSLAPSSDVANKVQDCFQKFGHANQANPTAMFANLPPSVKECVKEKLGGAFDALQSGQTQPTPEMADTIRVCFQAMEISSGQFGPAGTAGQGSSTGNFGPPPQAFQNIIRSAPPQVSSCLQEKFGGDLDKVGSGDLPPSSDTQEKLGECFRSFRPGGKGNEPPNGSGPAPGFPGANGSGTPGFPGGGEFHGPMMQGNPSFGGSQSSGSVPTFPGFQGQHGEFERFNEAGTSSQEMFRTRQQFQGQGSGGFNFVPPQGQGTSGPGFFGGNTPQTFNGGQTQPQFGNSSSGQFGSGPTSQGFSGQGNFTGGLGGSPSGGQFRGQTGPMIQGQSGQFPQGGSQFQGQTGEPQGSGSFSQPSFGAPSSGVAPSPSPSLPPSGSGGSSPSAPPPPPPGPASLFSVLLAPFFSSVR